MWKTPLVFSLAFFSLSPITQTLAKDEMQGSKTPPKQESKSSSFHSFTGKIKKNKVRLRTQPNLEACIVREINKDEMFVVIDESGDFYAVQPPKDTKAFIFRTFVLDNVIEGSRVNVRLEPDLEAPVIAQLNSGDRIQGNICSQNNKWLEITPPSTTRFYVAKEFIDKIGDASLLANLEKRKGEVVNLLSAAKEKAQVELAKPYEEISIEPLTNSIQQIVQEYKDFPEYITQAQELLTHAQSNYTQKRIVYLENKAKTSSDTLQVTNQQLKEEIRTQRERLGHLEEQLKKHHTSLLTPEQTLAAIQRKSEGHSAEVTARMSFWNEAEEAIFNKWLVNHQDESHTMKDFYDSEKSHSVTLKGILELYEKPLKNKPGDYILIDPSTHLPIAYLYSTRTNMEDYLGHEVTLMASPRFNHYFAFPAYYVLGVELNSNPKMSTMSTTQGS